MGVVVFAVRVMVAGVVAVEDMVTDKVGVELVTDTVLDTLVAPAAIPGLIKTWLPPGPNVAKLIAKALASTRMPKMCFVLIGFIIANWFSRSCG